jgi:aminoglycoside phosphotransferase (APT) family kinase protein
LSDFVIDEGLVRSLLREQHPDLADQDLRPGATGWDNQLWRLGGTLAVRLPRTARAPGLLRKEQHWLPVLAPRLPLPVPTPVRIGEPSARFPCPWTIATWVRGEPGDRAPISQDGHAAGTLAGFLRALHLNAPAEAPSNPMRGVPLRTLTHEFGTKFHATASSSVAADVRDVWDQAVSAPDWPGPPVWLHGDLHPANVVVSDGTLSGVIDFGELCAGDPATDLAAAWLLLPAGAAARFFDAYENADEAMIRRARGWAVLDGLSLIGIGQAWERGLPGGQPTWGPAGRRTLDRVLSFSFRPQ